MKQAVMTAPGRIKFQDIPKPKAGPNQVVVKVKNIGICGSDIHVYHGKHPYTSYPVVQGHEASGEVEVVGSEVTGVQISKETESRSSPRLFAASATPASTGVITSAPT